MIWLNVNLAFIQQPFQYFPEASDFLNYKEFIKNPQDCNHLSVGNL